MRSICLYQFYKETDVFQMGVRRMQKIFTYTDYRKYLHDYYLHEKEKSSDFSYRYLAEKVGFKSAGFFTKVINGDTNISTEMAENFAAVLEFSRREHTYFHALVAFNQESDREKKKELFKVLLKYKEIAVYNIELHNYEFYDHWYHSAIKEVLAYFDVTDNFAELADQLIPRVSVPDVKRSVALLERLGLIKKDAQGIYRQTHKMISCGRNEINRLARENFVKDSLSLAVPAIATFPRGERTHSATTMSISKETFHKMVDKIRALRDELMEMVESDSSPDQSYLLMYQLFPISKERGDKT